MILVVHPTSTFEATFQVCNLFVSFVSYTCSVKKQYVMVNIQDGGGYNIVRFLSLFSLTPYPQRHCILNFNRVLVCELRS